MRTSPLIIIVLLALICPSLTANAEEAKPARPVFARDNLVAWCIVPFDAKKRNPTQRAEMLDRLGLKRLAYDWRDQHVKEFEEEILVTKKHGIEFFSFWSTHEEAFKLFEKHKITPQVWVIPANPAGDSDEAKVEAAGKALLPLVERTRKLGCKLSLYNHGGWNGRPRNLLAICRWLRKQGKDGSNDHVGIVYNFHHAHGDLDEAFANFRDMTPYLHCVNLNGMIRTGPKILPVGEGEEDLRMLKLLKESDYTGPVGILNHVESEDAEVQLRKNIEGLKRLLKTIGDEAALKTYKD